MNEQFLLCIKFSVFKFLILQLHISSDWPVNTTVNIFVRNKEQLKLIPYFACLAPIVIKPNVKKHFAELLQYYFRVCKNYFNKVVYFLKLH